MKHEMNQNNKCQQWLNILNLKNLIVQFNLVLFSSECMLLLLLGEA